MGFRRASAFSLGARARERRIAASRRRELGTSIYVSQSMCIARPWQGSGRKSSAVTPYALSTRPQGLCLHRRHQQQSGAAVSALGSWSRNQRREATLQYFMLAPMIFASPATREGPSSSSNPAWDFIDTRSNKLLICEMFARLCRSPGSRESPAT